MAGGGDGSGVEWGRTPRLEWLLGRLQHDRRIDVLAVAGLLGVAPETIRRDLGVLERQGKLERVHGGAVALQPATAAPSDGPEEHDLAFSRHLWARLPRSGTLLIGAGNAGLRLAQAVATDPPVRPGLTVLTHALDVAIVLSRATTLSVYNLGGSVREGTATHTLEGDWSITELRRFTIDTVVLRPDGVSAQTGLSQHTTTSADIAQAAVGSARRVVVIGDADNLGRSAFVRFAGVGQIAEVVAPDDATGEVGARTLAELADHGVLVSPL